MSPVQHPSGVVAIATLRARSLDDVMLGIRRRDRLLLVGVQDPGNVGAIIRAAEACGATGVIVGRRVRRSRSAGRRSAARWAALFGADRRARRCRRSSAGEAHGVRVFAAVPRGGRHSPTAISRAAAAILLGGEGLPPELVAADRRR